MLEIARNITFISDAIMSPVQFDSNADRMPVYMIWDYTSPTGIGRLVAIEELSYSEKYIKMVAPFKWFTKDGKPPADVPECGFDGSLCIYDNSQSIAGGVLGSLVLVSIIIAAFYYGIKKKIFEEELTKVSWKINFNDVKILSKPPGSQTSSKTMGSDSVGSSVSSNIQQVMNSSNIGQYQFNLVYIKMITRSHIVLTREDMIELKQMHGWSHENINNFLGASVDPPNMCVLFKFCTKGSLKNILENPDFKMDAMFAMSFVWDIITGMLYIHESFLKSHGRLKSTNCVVDRRWVVKITDYGPSILRQKSDIEVEDHKALLWTAPEILRALNPPSRVTQQADIYSFAIILHEICYRQGTFNVSNMNYRDIIGRVRNGESIPFRPTLNTEIGSINDPDHVLKNLMEICWAEDPNQRPDFITIKSYLKSHTKEVTGNIMDNVLKKMDRYTSNLETMVEQRTQALEEEKKKTENLLYQLLPRWKLLVTLI
ncbi:atrial natriuretic peptide receptor 1 [Octopus bimaculoides]|nr:atrial natriuretic peptide receptor 1 [Octopus bimaculoides]